MGLSAFEVLTILRFDLSSIHNHTHPESNRASPFSTKDFLKASTEPNCVMIIESSANEGVDCLGDRFVQKKS
jgi:hypothetical protein